MPPTKKTKPNDKCPCGSGKKHKKCCMVAGKLASTVAATAVLDEVMAALTLNITATNNTATTAAAASERSGPSCCHGSTSTHFPDGRAYNDVITGILAVQKLAVQKDDQEKIVKLCVDQEENLNDVNFCQYIFAVCTSWYLKTKTTNSDMKRLLLLAAVHKYSSDADKVKRSSRAIPLDRGFIKCLAQETKSYCDCLHAKKREARGMAKTQICDGCYQNFPRKDMLICSGCKIAMYCNEDCQTQYWPEHREICAAVVRATEPSGTNDPNN